MTTSLPGYVVANLSLGKRAKTRRLDYVYVRLIYYRNFFLMFLDHLPWPLNTETSKRLFGTVIPGRINETMNFYDGHPKRTPFPYYYLKALGKKVL